MAKRYRVLAAALTAAMLLGSGVGMPVLAADTAAVAQIGSTAAASVKAGNAATAGSAATAGDTAAAAPAANAVNKPATAATAKANQSWYSRLDFNDKSEQENALRGLVEAPESVVIRDDTGKVVWSVDDFKTLNELETVPDTVNPSLARNTIYNSYAGLFQVCDGIYQIRGYDMANVTFIKSTHGWIVFDVLMCKEDMAAAKALMEKYFGELNIVAVMYSHCHADHFGGIYGLISDEDVADKNLSLEEQLASGKVPILAPAGFLDHAISENVYAGIAMSRRAQYQYGTLLDAGETGRLAMGIGLGQSAGSGGLVPPTYEVKSDETIAIDGVKIEFMLTPGTEAPAEMNAYFPQYRALWMAENCTGTMHNLYTLRGAEVRDAASWAAYILSAEQKFADKSDVVFQSHNWPHWGTENIRQYLENTAAVYRYINDQTLHYINLGYTSNEIANMLELPDALNQVWYMRQYYGTLSHNVKAVYQKYMGWYDANPVNLDPLSPEDTAKKWVEYLGDPAKVLEKARKDYEKGEYQWVAQVTKELVYADPANQEARDLCADALEQLGYQAESGTWRNAYLTGALELRQGNSSSKAGPARNIAALRLGMTPAMALDYIDIATDAIAAQNDDLSLNLILTDTGDKIYVRRKSGVLLVYENMTDPTADCTMTGTKTDIMYLVAGRPQMSGQQKLEGDTTVPTRLVKYMTNFTRDFNIIEP